MVQNELSICIAIPCKNNSWNAFGILESIRCQTDTVNEIILVDDNSSVNESRTLQRLANTYNARYICLGPPLTPEENLGRRSSARNAATKCARSDVVLYLDGDMLLHPEYIKEIRHYHSVDPWALVRGQRYSISISDQQKGMPHCLGLSSSSSTLAQESIVLYTTDKNQEHFRWSYPASITMFLAPHLVEKKLSRRDCIVQGLLFFASLTFFGRLGFLKGKTALPYSTRWDWCASHNLSVRRKHVLHIGLWDENFLGWGEEDMDFAYRLVKAGLRPVIPCGTPLRAYHLDHATDSEANRRTLLRNAQYLISKFPELLPVRLSAYQNYGIYSPDILIESQKKKVRF